MKNLWNDSDAAKLKGDLLKLRIYTSQLLGKEPDLVLHGGGNTSVKITESNLYGETEEILYVKGSGWDLSTILAEGFAPVRMKALLQMAQLEKLSDSDMVKYQRAAMTNPYAPNPSVEAILHAIIPFRFVDHTHADAVVTISNTPAGEKKIHDIYGENMLLVPYVMPGFILSKTVYDLTRNLDWKKLEGIVLLNHGVFTFHDDPRESYERMIATVSKAERYLKSINATVVLNKTKSKPDLTRLAQLRKAVAEKMGAPAVALLNDSPEARGFSELKNAASIATRGPITPDHIIRTKRIPLITGANLELDIERYSKEYEKYFKTYADGKLTMLDPAPRWAVLPGDGIVSFGKSMKDAAIINDIIEHTIKAIQQGERLGGWKPLPQKDLFEVEYWELEQVKLKKGGADKTFQGQITLVSGAASGIGKACALALAKEGATVAALDINPDIEKIFESTGIFGIRCDVTDEAQIISAVERAVKRFGGLDLLVSNAGIFSKSAAIEDLDDATWHQSMSLNLNSHRLLLKTCIPYLKLGIAPSVVFTGSKNVPAPGPGAAAYSAAKAALAQLTRVAALELGKYGIRVNIVHPNAVFDTGVWTDDVLRSRAKQYGLSVQEYKTNNILNAEVTSKEVAAGILALLSPAFSKTTGAQVPIDGGNERVI